MASAKIFLICKDWETAIKNNKLQIQNIKLQK